MELVLSPQSQKIELASEFVLDADYGFAAGCEAEALPRRHQPEVPGLGPSFGLSLSILLG